MNRNLPIPPAPQADAPAESVASPTRLDDAHLPTSKWITFLRQYGPIPQSGNQYDEDIQRLARARGLEPILLPAPAIEDILTHLQAEPPRSVIVTGTAGDGKTFHCRQVWRRLAGAPEAWDELEKVKHLPLGARELCVIRDLSEFNEEDRDQVMPQIAADMLKEDPDRVYLIAANDGRLLELLSGVPHVPNVVELHSAIEDLLVMGRTEHDRFRVTLINLGQQSAVKMLPAIIDAIAEHPDWIGCEGCAFRSPAEGSRCPIYENRLRLSGSSDGGVLRGRLQQLMELSEHNHIHFPVRQLLLLVSNIVLGHPDADHGLMTCESVPRILAAGTEDRASIYRNILGENLSSRRRDKTAIFDTLGRFGIGAETSNHIDGLLVYGTDDPELRGEFDRLVGADPVYGGSPSFLGDQRAYLEGGDDTARANFLAALRSQRQRLFFTIGDDEVARVPVWDLTVFRYAGDYLRMLRRMRDGEQRLRDVALPLVRGLNRIFTGVLVSNQEELLLASSGSHTQAKTSQIYHGMVLVDQRPGEDVTLDYVADRPHLSVAFGATGAWGPVRLDLTLLRYEFLRRVADGALPSSFSLECYEDFLAFKANVMSAHEGQRRDRRADAVLVLRFLGVGDDGRAHHPSVEIRLA
jgi:hypothetical protein